MDVREEILTLRRQLEHANFLYYVKDAPEISDFEYDALMRRLEELEAAHPEYASPDSPTQHVGGYALNTFAQVRHQVPLESLQDVFSFDELRAFGARMDGALTQTHDYSVEPKIDGLSMSLEYENGVFVRGATRGAQCRARAARTAAAGQSPQRGGGLCAPAGPEGRGGAQARYHHLQPPV